ncbi:hypothetical protein ACFFRR_008234 [Megaselia abdita]
MSSKESPKEAPSRPKIMRNIHRNKLLTHVKIGVGIALVSAVIFKFAVQIPKQNRYAEFYSNYNADESFERMVIADVLSSTKCEKKKKETDPCLPPDPNQKKKEEAVVAPPK